MNEVHSKRTSFLSMLATKQTDMTAENTVIIQMLAESPYA